MPWIYLAVAGLLEVTWSTLMKQSAVSQRPGLLLVSILASFFSFGLLYLAMRHVPLGTSYAIWTGIGAIGATLLGIAWFGESSHPARFFFLGLVVVGVVGLKWLDGTK